MQRKHNNLNTVKLCLNLFHSLSVHGNEIHHANINYLMYSKLFDIFKKIAKTNI